ncbi:glycoside hydrolase family 16 protein [Vararia minispora EC-137]|uniref:Glycoside hydrolase family 16 protein n=1 Tax=Vararia minispora EC-137 TaxID=1314806 RepID=A0ACB8QSH1_9AGAM|nr:glycoside hydrolase family 16 protein [Vararia minispora EC-137]
MPPRNELAQGVAIGSIGGGYGPYAHDPHGRQGGYGAERHSNTPSESSLAAAEKDRLQPTTNTVPAFIWDTKDPELDDALHNPDPRLEAALDRRVDLFSLRGWINASAVLLITLGLLMLFAGYPIISGWNHASPNAPFRSQNLGGSNASGTMFIPSLIDADTPQSAYTKKGSDGNQYNLIFSDEFNRDGRSFYPGDDPYWTAMDFHYWSTGDLEWYDPAAATTKGGALVLTMSEKNTHDLNFQSAMLQTWNQFCFTTGIYEIAISLPGNAQTPGFWPGAWSMGNLGRAGYGATTEGTWPYSYDSCDLGTFPNQTYANSTPVAVTTGGDAGSALSFLPGQRLSACTCPGSDHPGPSVDVGRAAPEIDIIEARIDTTVLRGQSSQSLQTAPFNYQYMWPNQSAIASITDTSVTQINTYHGDQYQQALSAQSYVNSSNYNLGGGGFGVYSYEWWSNPNKRNEGYIQWAIDGANTWKVDTSALAGDSITQISSRLIPEEPMYLIVNFGMAPSFQKQDFANLRFPAQMLVDYVRVYQRSGVKDGLGCDPAAHPTAQYIQAHSNAYTNANLTTWAQAGYTFPRNSAYTGC